MLSEWGILYISKITPYSIHVRTLNHPSVILQSSNS